MIMMKVCWLVLEGILIWFFLYFGSGAALTFAVLMVLIPLISMPVNLYVKRQLQISIDSAVSLRKGDPGSIAVTVDNPTLFPALRICCDVVVQNHLNREKHCQRLMTYALQCKMQKSELRLASEYCNCEAVAHMTVQPDIFAPTVTLGQNLSSVDDSDLYSQERPGVDLTETYQIREYIPGDSIRQIHWKLSNKFDKMIVRDPGLPITRNVLVFWERTGESGDPDIIDAQAEVVISLCRSLMDNSIQFTLGWNDTDRNLCVLHSLKDMDDLVAIIPRLLRATGAKDGVSGASLLLQTKMEALCSHMVYIAEEPQSEVAEMQRYGHVSVLAYGGAAPEGSVLFDDMDYVQQLSQIEI